MDIITNPEGTRELIRRIKQHLMMHRKSIKEFSEEIGVEYGQCYQTLRRESIPQTSNRGPYLDYYEKHRKELDAIKL